MKEEQNATYLSCHVLIIGGGPCGLATALMLAKRGWTDIIVLEKRPSADYYEPDKSFNYLIDGRGQKLLDLLGLTDQLAEVGVPSKEFYLTRIDPQGKRKTFKLPLVDPKRKTAYWLPRKNFLSLLAQEIQRNWQNQIEVKFETECLQIEKTNAPEKLQILARTNSGVFWRFEPRLLAGCDGLHSIARRTLAQWEEGTNRFEMQQYPSPSTGLRYKVLTLPPQFPLDLEEKERAICDMAYNIRGVFQAPHQALSLGLFPVKQPDETRSANIITRPEHQLWKLNSGEQVYDFFKAAFPQLPIGELLSPQEAERFANSEGGRFPPPQYCRGTYWLLSQQRFNQGAIILGDAVHCFPPDIGQGVNSALEDIYILDRVLAQSDDDLTQALPQYEEKRAPDNEALARLAQVAFPWQYNQDPLRRKFWSINFFLRLGLSRLLPGLINPPAFILIQDYQLDYQHIWSKAQKTTRNLYTAGLLLIGCLLLLGIRGVIDLSWG